MHPLAGRHARGLLLALARGEGFLLAGRELPLAVFLERSRLALNLASDRVEDKYGWRCSRALAQLSRLEAAAKGFDHLPDARVTVDTFEE